MTSPDSIIRPLSASDEADWRRLWTEYLAFYGTTVPDAVYDTTFARLLGGDPHDFSGSLALRGGKAVGLVHYLFHRHCWRAENVCYLQDLYVDPAARGSGLGRRLITAVYDAADKAGAPAVYWLTQAENTTARQLYDRIGQPTTFMKYQRPQ